MQLNYRGDKATLDNNAQHSMSNGMMGGQGHGGGKDSAEFFANFKGKFVCLVSPAFIFPSMIFFMKSLISPFSKP